ncbi:phosphatidylinositide phosphatase SAC2 isoform X2 [Phlebotomus argentipes]|uniref:phosphatidylinositide phosphatase SAC2 isoform X2 n=1 Tax=Phlebotomus argentipes TaxID=94469 RepID=UPI0028937348|nr:phosphatidylinositide phosphatase SAC2 isoform X2 [Phlebotomus argentipes]
MELFQTTKHYIFVRKDRSLWWNRQTGEFKAENGCDLSAVDDIECLGLTPGIVGALQLPGVLEPHLMIIREATPVGVIYPPNIVYKIKSVLLLNAEEPEAILSPCSRHSTVKEVPRSNVLLESSQLMNKTWGAMKSASSTIKSSTQHAALLASTQVKSSVGIKDTGRIERKVTEELHRMFDDSDSFYYCSEADITQSLQRRGCGEDDERFFWNKHMLSDILKLSDKFWALPIIQGFVQVEHCVMEKECFTLSLISRRSRFRAGTRYKRRGVDEQGYCANYVETEQILSFGPHQMSFVQIRGSVPIYWTQPGFKYRPPPRINRDAAETQIAFEKHFTRELQIYRSICIINLIDQAGKEKIVGDAYARHTMKYNNENVAYCVFDFHNICRGMRYENVTILTDALAGEINSMGFHWCDAKGTICDQKAIFRVNCMDCLDRTNVVQTALAKVALESQLIKLGIVSPCTAIPDRLRESFMVLWANNGDIISRQYAGTNALKGDFTRTGERKFAGIMRDGMNSANRYYLAQFRDTYRQATIDLMLGNQISDELLTALGGQQAIDESDAIEAAEHARLLVEDCRLIMLGATQCPIGAWGLINADPRTGDPNETELDTILLLADDCFMVAEYDSHLDKIVNFDRVALSEIEMIECGLLQQTKLFQGNVAAHPCIRINCLKAGKKDCFMLRSSNIRFFNNTASIIKTNEEMAESLNAIVEFFRIALESCGRSDVPFICGGVLQRRKSRTTVLDVPKGVPRNLSESQLVQFGSKALSNVAGQFSKLGQTLNSTKSKGRNAKSAASVFHTTAKGGVKEKCRIQPGETSSESDENDCSIYEPNTNEYVQTNPLYSENVFLPSVGIVMSEPTNIEQAVECVETSKEIPTINVNASKDDSTSDGQISASDKPNAMKLSQSSSEIGAAATVDGVPKAQKDLSLNLSGSHSETTLRQLKTLTSPLSKLAKGMQNLGIAFDPRKKVNKSDLQDIPSEYARNLQKEWENGNCKSKLVAL